MSNNRFCYRIFGVIKEKIMRYLYVLRQRYYYVYTAFIWEKSLSRINNNATPKRLSQFIQWNRSKDYRSTRTLNHQNIRL